MEEWIQNFLHLILLLQSHFSLAEFLQKNFDNFGIYSYQEEYEIQAIFIHSFAHLLF